jgi:hypothetical protein
LAWPFSSNGSLDAATWVSVFEPSIVTVMERPCRSSVSMVGPDQLRLHPLAGQPRHEGHIRPVRSAKAQGASIVSCAA